MLLSKAGPPSPENWEWRRDLFAKAGPPTPDNWEWWCELLAKVGPPTPYNTEWWFKQVKTLRDAVSVDELMPLACKLQRMLVSALKASAKACSAHSRGADPALYRLQGVVRHLFCTTAVKPPCVRCGRRFRMKHFMRLHAPSETCTGCKVISFYTIRVEAAKELLMTPLKRAEVVASLSGVWNGLAGRLTTREDAARSVYGGWTGKVLDLTVFPVWTVMLGEAGEYVQRFMETLHGPVDRDVIENFGKVAYGNKVTDLEHPNKALAGFAQSRLSQAAADVFLAVAKRLEKKVRLRGAFTDKELEPFRPCLALAGTDPEAAAQLLHEQ